MKVLLVQPHNPPSFWAGTYEIQFLGKKAVFPPLGLLTVAALLPERWEKRLVDLNVSPLSSEDLRWADYVFLGGMNVHEASIREVVARCRAEGCTVVGGGPLFTHEYERFVDIDHFVLNEAELTLPPFVEAVERGETPRRVYATDERADVRKTPIPLWELADLDQYAALLVQYSRGCPYQCDFCDVTSLFGRRPRTKSGEQIVRELESIPNRGRFEFVFFADDNLLGNKRDLKADLLPTLTEWRKTQKDKPWFITQLTINLADDDEMMAMMTGAGFGGVFIGIETPDEASLLACRKRQNTNRDLAENVRHIHRNGIEVMAGFIVGFDGDDETVFDRQAEFIEHCGLPLVMISMLNAPVGTELHARMSREGRLLEDTWHSEGGTNLVPTMGMDALRRGYAAILTHLYEPANFYERAKTFLTDFQPSEELGEGAQKVTDLSAWLALLRSIVVLGLMDRGRLYYWKLFFWTLFHRPGLLAKAPVLSVRGYHFRRVTEDTLERMALPAPAPTSIGRALPVVGGGGVG